MVPRLLAILFIAILIWLFIRSRYPIRVTIDDRGIKSGTKLPPLVYDRLSEFAQENLLPDEQIKLKGQIVSGRIRWVVPDSANPHLAQRLRNFMFTEID